MKNVSQIRREYVYEKLDKPSAPADPIVLFGSWLHAAIESQLTEPTAMALSTSDASGKPSSRIVLLKEFDQNGFTFFTNYDSKKGKHIQENPAGALLFFWDKLERQVRIEGTIQKISGEKSDKYFEQRPEKSRIGAWSSPQSTPIPSREVIEKLFVDWTKKFENKPIQRPSNWGGYMLKPELIEFWQGREHRLHDRIEYKKDGAIWSIHRLAP